jgi:hypothetical protein
MRPYIMYILTGQTQDVRYIPLAYEATGGRTHFEDQWAKALSASKQLMSANCQQHEMRWFLATLLV